MKRLEELLFENSYSKLPEIFYSRHATSPLKNPHLISFNAAAAELIELDQDEFRRKDFVDVVSGKKHLQGFDPLAMCYSGHHPVNHRVLCWGPFVMDLSMSIES